MNDSPLPTDSEIESAVRRTLSGETMAFEAIVRHFERPLRVWVATQAPPTIDVDDIAQRTLIAAFSQLGKYQPGTNFAAWLFTIARYQLKSELTHLHRIADYHTRFAPELLQRELDRRNDSMPELQERRLTQLQRCVASLSEQESRFVVWRYDESLPLEQIAAHSGRSVAAVKKQLWKIRRRLQECVERHMSTAAESL
ncbi:MAG: sigma-70 family RNA polymerase sigma factor [Rubripirellula sp.]